MDQLDAGSHRIGQHRVRATFRPQGRDRPVVDPCGIPTVRGHAEEPTGRGRASAEPSTGGRRTPDRGHPVFVAQHATATCRRACPARRHDIPAGQALDGAGRGAVVEAIRRWIAKQHAPHPPPRSPG